MAKSGKLSVLTKGILRENPVFVLILGTCPTLGMTGKVTDALGMGLATMAVLICSNVVISLLRKIIPEVVRIPCYIVVIAGFVTIVKMILEAFLPDLYTSLGMFIPLITVNCIILGRAEMFASKNKVLNSALDGIGMGIGFTLALFAMATVREVIGAGSFAGIEIPFLFNEAAGIDYRIGFFSASPGGLLVYGLLIALVSFATKGKVIKKKSFSCEGCPSAGVCNGGCANKKEGE